MKRNFFLTTFLWYEYTFLEGHIMSSHPSTSVTIFLPPSFFSLPNSRPFLIFLSNEDRRLGPLGSSFSSSKTVSTFRIKDREWVNDFPSLVSFISLYLCPTPLLSYLLYPLLLTLSLLFLQSLLYFFVPSTTLYICLLFSPFYLLLNLFPPSFFYTFLTPFVSISCSVTL